MGAERACIEVFLEQPVGESVNRHKDDDFPRHGELGPCGAWQIVAWKHIEASGGAQKREYRQNRGHDEEPWNGETAVDIYHEGAYDN